MARGVLAGLFVCVATLAPAAPPEIITAAKYTDPTTRYAHGVLGDAVEWGALRLTVGTCVGCEGDGPRHIVIRLPETRVFEDIAPRLVDVDGDDVPEVIVVESDHQQGARLAIYDQDGLRAAGPFIGQAFRWLAPVGVADLDGDGAVELAYIDRPHLAKLLRVWRYTDGTLTLVAEQPGLTNHRIGEDFITGGLRDCGEGLEMITASADWRRVMATRLQPDGMLQPRDLGPATGRASFQAALGCAD